MPTFYEVQQKYLKLLQASDNTKKTYRIILNKHWNIYLRDTPIKLIDYEVIMEILIEKDMSTKYLNQILIPLRGVFATAFNLRYITFNPMDLIHNRKLQKELPDPFTRSEMTAILSWLKENNHNAYLFYKLAFWTGLRPCEILPLTWQDVYENHLYIHQSRVDGKTKPTTKTNTVRQVILNKHSKEALQEIKQSELAGYYVFTVPNSNRSYFSNSGFRQWFKQALKELNIRERPSYNTRHTYATMLLMDGINPTLIANQLGHSLQVLTKNYARWLNSERDLMEMSKLTL